MSRIFFTSDTHFLHANIVLSRPSFHSDELREAIRLKDLALRRYADGSLDSKGLTEVARRLDEALKPCMERMHDTLTENWNSVVTPVDRVFHLGDFALSWGRNWEPLIAPLLCGLNGQKFLIEGNHDRKEVISQPGWTWVRQYHELKEDLGGVHKQRIVLSHYAMRTWNQMHRGAWMLHGHSHGSLPDIGGKTLDVGVDVWNFTPVSLEAIAETMHQRPVVLAGDHHI